MPVIRRIAIAIFAFAAFAVLVPGQARAAKAEAKVVIKYYTPLGTGSWSGLVKSERKACKKDRKVILYRRAGEKNEKIGSSTTSREGNKWYWTVFDPAGEEGKYFALAPPTCKCKRSESKLFDYPDDNEPPFR